MTMVLTLDLATEHDTARLGRALSAVLRAGDTLLLEGSIGAGKSHLARAFIRARLGAAEDVPSPTFTLVQTYPGPPDIWHADLYRLTHPDEVLELGLDDAFATAICLIEWPDRLGPHLPSNPIRLRLTTQGDGRSATLTFDRPGFAACLTAALRTEIAVDFIETAGWADADRTPLTGDASARRYERLSRADATAILMDAPPGQADSVADFVEIDRHLLSLNLSAPRILAEDAAQGFLLLEDLGELVFPKLIAANPALEVALYCSATDVLTHLQAAPPARDLANLSAQDWAEAAAIAVDWYSGIREGRTEFVTALAQTLKIHADGPRVMILRDYHAENLLWLPERAGLARVGLLDFQLAQLGQPGYDLVSLLQDARRDVPPAIETAMIHHFANAKGLDLAGFRTAYSVLGAQRALRILGIFARLCLKDEKPRYLRLIPRVWGHLDRNLSDPALSDLRAICRKLLPEPTAATLQKLEDKCGAFR